MVQKTAEQVVFDVIASTEYGMGVEQICDALRKEGMLADDGVNTPAPSADRTDPWNSPEDVNSPKYKSPWEKAQALMGLIRGAQYDVLRNRPLHEAALEIESGLNSLDELIGVMLESEKGGAR